MKSLLKDNRGSGIDVLTIATAVFVFGITFLIFFYVQADVLYGNLTNTEMGAVPNFNETLMKGTTDVAVTYDGLVLAIYAGLIIAFILSAFLVRTTPAFLFIWILVLIISVVVAVPLANSYTLVQASLGHAADFGMTGWLIDHLPMLTAAAGVFGIVAMYAKSRYFEEA